MAAFIPILLYHSVSDDASPQFRRWAIRSAAFKAHLAHLREQGYQALTVTQFVQAKYVLATLPERPVVITFDDGFADFYTNALPALSEYDFVATLYVVTGRVGKTSTWLSKEGEGQRRMMTWAQLQSLADHGIECGAHTHTHPQLDVLPRAQARREIERSKAVLEDRLCRRVTSFAYPHGFFDRAVRDMARDAGFTSAAAVKHALSSTGDDPFALARLIVEADTSVEQLGRWLAGDGARVAPAKEAARTKAWRFIRRCTARCRTSLGSPASQDDGFEPAKVVEIELSQPLPAITPISIAEGLEVGSHTRTCARALIYAQLFGQPIGAVELTLPDAGLGAAGVADRLWFHLHDTILMRLAEEGLPGITELDISGVRTTEKPKSQKDYESFLAHAPFVSVIVPTHNRPDRIVNALHQLLAQDYPRFEIIVVDNAPRDDQTAAAIQQQFGHVSQVRYVHEPMAGLSRARNCGFRIARGEFAAFPDDDLIYGRRWLSHLIQGFYAADDVGCVAGLILPAELETRAQLWLEQYGGFSKGFARRIFDLHEHRPADRLFPYTSGSCGSGANTAVKASVLREIGGFDETLSTGTPAFGGEDLALFFDVLTHGHAVVYEPAAVSYHPHAREYAALKRQMYGYGAGLTAYLTRCLLNKPSRIFEIAMRAPQGIAFALSPSSKKNACKQTGYPKELTRAELRGMAYGPIAYWRSVRRARMVRAKASISQPKLEREYARVHARVHEHTHE